MHNLVAPDISSCLADATNAVAADEGPRLDRIAHDRLPRNRAQAESEHANLNSVAQEAVLKAAPRHRQDSGSDSSDQNPGPQDYCRPSVRQRDNWKNHGGKDQQAP